MENIISKLYELIKDTTNLVEMEERAQILMYEFFALLMGRVFSELNDAIVKQRIEEEWKAEVTDPRSIQFMFGAVTFDERNYKKVPIHTLAGMRIRSQTRRIIVKGPLCKSPINRSRS